MYVCVQCVVVITQSHCFDNPNSSTSPPACAVNDEVPSGIQFMINLLVSSLMVGQGLENALMTAIAFEVQDPTAILKPGLESPVPLLQLVQQLVGNSTSQQTTCLKQVCTYIPYLTV